ncbi:MAG: ABC transporter ATP-binding protein [Bacilli bacterium]|nr:ABC transporter ATP-binding protein [Bacilli bacterium]MBR4672178.1 ABC transporter ATP-binding protein [Bacilli bacterium]
MPRPNRGVPEKSKDFKGAMKKLFASLNKWKYLVIVSLVLALISAILALITPNKLSNLTDTITEGIRPQINENTIREILASEDISDQDKSAFIEMAHEMEKEGNSDNNGIGSLAKLDTLSEPVKEKIKPIMDLDKIKGIAIILLALHAVSAILNFIQAFTLTTVSNRYAKNLRAKISTKINKLPLRYFDSHETGDVLSRITNDVDMVAQNMDNTMSTLVTSITLLLGSTLMMFITNWVMAITAIIASIIGFAFSAFILKRSQKYFTARQKELGKMNGHIEEVYSGHNVIKTCNATKLVTDEFDELNKSLYDCNRKSQFLSGLMGPTMGFVGNLGYVAVCIVGAILTSNNIITFGVIVAFMIYVRMFTNPLSQIAQALTALQSIAAASERVFEFLEENEMAEEKTGFKKLKREDAKGKIEFKNVKFGYDEGKTIIKNFNLTATPGEKIAIVGPTGAGKTTMVNLLMKFYEIKDGDIIIDGISTKELTRENIHDLFIMVLQDTWLFDGTVRDNLKFNNEVRDETIWDACSTVGVDHFIRTLPGQLDAEIDNSDSISQGQKQLLTIARGMIKDAPFLILDEATSSVDTRTEEIVQRAMDKLTIGRTSFIIAHRLSTIKNANLILVMNEGNIVEQGTHEELMKKNGFYADLYNSQFKK